MDKSIETKKSLSRQNASVACKTMLREPKSSRCARRALSCVHPGPPVAHKCQVVLGPRALSLLALVLSYATELSFVCICLPYAPSIGTRQPCRVRGTIVTWFSHVLKFSVNLYRDSMAVRSLSRYNKWVKSVMTEPLYCARLGRVRAQGVSLHAQPSLSNSILCSRIFCRNQLCRNTNCLCRDINLLP